MNTSFDNFRKDHRELLDHTMEIDEVLAALTHSISPLEQERLLSLLERFIELLYTHDHRESNELFKAHRDRIPEPDRWQVRMVEVQDEMILNEARRLYELASGELSAEMVARLRDNEINLVRWIREHIVVEEKHLFPRFGEARPRFACHESGIQRPKRYGFWNRIKSLFKQD